MNNIRTTSNAIAVDELDKAILTKLIKDYDCHNAIILVRKKNQDVLPSVTHVDNTAFDTQSSVNSSIDIEEADLIDFSNTPDDTNQQNATELDINIKPEPLNIDLDELEKICFKMAQERSKSSVYDNSLHSKTTFTSEATNSIDRYSKINERNDTPAVVVSKLNRSYSEMTVPGYRLEEKSKILIPKLERNVSNAKTNKLEMSLSSLRDFLKSDSTQRKCNENAIIESDHAKISQFLKSDNKFENVSLPKLKHSVSDASHSRHSILGAQNAFSNVRNTFEKLEILDREPINFTLDGKPNYNEIFTERFTLNLTETPQNQISRDVHDMSEIFKNCSLDRHHKDSVPKLPFDEIARNEDYDEIYDDLLDELSSKSHNRATLSNNTIEPVTTSFHTSIPLSQRVITNSVAQHDTKDRKGNTHERLYTSNSGDGKNSAISEPITRISQPGRRIPKEFVLNEEQKVYINKLLNSRYNIVNPLMYYFPENFYEPDPRNNDNYVVIMRTRKMDRKLYKTKRIVTCETDREKFTVGPDFEEKQKSLPQMMIKLKDKKARLDKERNLKKRLILASGTIQSNYTRSSPNISSNRPHNTAESAVTLKPVVLMEDCNRERMRAHEKRQRFDLFMQTGSYL